jgi:hypothetical protein
MKIIEEMSKALNLIRISFIVFVLIGCESKDQPKFAKTIIIDEDGRIHKYLKYDLNHNLEKRVDLFYYDLDTSIAIKNFGNNQLISEIEFNSELSSLNQIMHNMYNNDKLLNSKYYDFSGNEILTLCYDYYDLDSSKLIQLVYKSTDSGFVAIDSVVYTYNASEEIVKLESFDIITSDKYYQELTKYIDDTLISERQINNKKTGLDEMDKYFYNANKQLVAFEKFINGKIVSLEKVTYKDNLIDRITRTSNSDTLHLKYFYK